MINKITFPKKGKGYIYERITKPEEPNRCYRDYEQQKSTYAARLKFWQEHKGEFVLPCSNNLVGKTFTFAPDKVNILFWAKHVW